MSVAITEREATMKINPSLVRIVVGIFVLTAFIFLSGCQGGIHHLSASGAAPEQATESGPPFVEAMLEFVGPPERWAGPKTVILHLQARDAEPASVLVTPNPGMPIPRPGGGAVSAAGHLSQPIARAELRALGGTMLETQASFTGCLYPIRARLVRADGSVLERQGCRSNTGWPVAVSRILSNAIETATAGRAVAGKSQAQVK
jgi:hypothetical protein